MYRTELLGPRGWYQWLRPDGGGPNAPELAATPGHIAVRHAAAPEEGVVLLFPVDAFAALVDAARAGQLDDLLASARTTQRERKEDRAAPNATSSIYAGHVPA